MQRDIFISYSRKDLDLVKLIKAEISRSIGDRFWMDLDGIEAGSSSFTKNLADAINQCKVFLFMLSDNSQSSPYALRELNYAIVKQKELGMHVVIINIDNCQLNDEFILYCGMTDIIMWTNPPQKDKLIRDLKCWVDTTDEEFKKYLDLAKAYLAKKERENYYETMGIAPPNPYYAYQLIALSDEEVNQIKPLKVKYGDNFVEHLNEVFDEPDFISDMFLGEPVDIDLDVIHHQYKFTIHSLDGEKVLHREILVDLSDEDYCKLLAWHLFNYNLVMNTLFYRDEELYKKIMRDVMCWMTQDGFVMVDYPFVVTMEEALADTEQIRKENNILKSRGYRILFF